MLPKLNKTSNLVLGLPGQKTAILAGIIGNVMEWYDFALYGFMATIIARLFFPNGSQTASLIATYGIFAAGFIMRPIGAAFFGRLGDTIGRSRTMLVSVIMMAIPTFCLGLLPTYEKIGLFAPVYLSINLWHFDGYTAGGSAYIICRAISNILSSYGILGIF